MRRREGRVEDQLKEVRQVQKRVCSWAISSALVLAVLFLVFHEKAVAKGLVLGTLFSILNFLLLGKTLPMLLGRSRSKANAIGMATTLARYLVLTVPMIIALKTVSFNFVAVVVGIFAVQIVTLIDYTVIKPLLPGSRQS